MRFKLSALAVLSLFAHSAFGFEPFTVQNIRIEGAERTEAGTIYNYLPVHVGDTFDQLRAQQGVAALFATGFFDDVKLEIEGNSLVVVVQERPIISKITFSGIKDISEDDLKKFFKSLGLVEARIFDQSSLDAAILQLKQQYNSSGKYLAQIKSSIKYSGKSQLEVFIDVSEGVAAKIEGINIIGASEIPESKLLGKIDSSKTLWWKPFATSNKYSKSRLMGDEEKIKSLYLNNGYIEFSLEPSIVTISPDKKDIKILLQLHEGGKYKINEIKVIGNHNVDDNELLSLIDINKGDIFSKEKVTKSINNIVNRLGDDGYAFANVNAIPEIDPDKKLVGFVFYIDTGKRVYVNSINITGNAVTKDEVIRRELRLLERTTYSASKIKRSKERLDLLGYFSETSINPVQIPNSSDQIDLKVEVTEKQTGNIQLGAGFSQGQGVVLNASVSQNNIFGTGNRLDLKLNGSKLNRTYSLSYVNPYWTNDGISRSFDIYQRYVDPTSVDLGAYTTETVGSKVRFGIPISETNSIYYSLGYEQQKMKLYDNSPQKYFDFISNFGDSYGTALATVGWSSDGRDSYISPSKGTYKNISLETGLPIADIRYFKLNYQHQWFYPLSDKFTIMANGELGWAKGYNGNELPFYLNFYGGGVQSVRGYKSGSLGPRDASNNSLGGDRRFTGNLELLFPLPNMEEDSSVRASVFLDSGAVYGSGDRLSLGELRYSSGLALSWVSPVGPLKFSLAYPLNKKEEDKTEVFQFSLGNIF